MNSQQTCCIILLTLASVFYLGLARTCSLDNHCNSFEHCCKGNCTAKRIDCIHVCHIDHDCSQEERCILGLCVNCTTHFPCEWKRCLNDTHCPGQHSCKNEKCEITKPFSLTGEMAPFVIFIAALAVSLMIVCYNDYFFERIGHRGCLSYIRSMNCNCRLTLWFWMWRLRRATQRNSNPCQPEIEVNFNSVIRPTQMLNEKSERRTCVSLSWISRRFPWLARREWNPSVCVSLSDEASSVEISENDQYPSIESPVILLNEFSDITRAPAMHERTQQIASRNINTDEAANPTDSGRTSDRCTTSTRSQTEEGTHPGPDCVNTEGNTCETAYANTNTPMASGSPRTIESNSCSLNTTTTDDITSSTVTNSLSRSKSTCSHKVTIV